MPEPTRERAAAYICPIVRVVEVDAVRGAIRPLKSSGDVRSQCGHAKHPPAVGDDLAALRGRTRMEDDGVLNLCCVVEA